MPTEQTQALASLLSKARLQWESRLREELLSLGMRQRRLCLLRERPGADEEEEVPWEGPHFVYTAEDLLDFVSGLRSDGASTASFSAASSSSASLPVLIRLPIQTPLLPTLQRYYALLKRKPPGASNGTAAAAANGAEGKKLQEQPLSPEEEEAQRLAAGTALLRSLRACINNSSGKKTGGGTTNTEERQRLLTLLRDFCKAGPVPPGLRAEIWSFLLLGSSTTVSAGTAGTGGEEKAASTAAATAAAAATVAFERLLEHCQRWEIITDDLLRWARGSGAWAEYITVALPDVAILPDDVTFEEGASALVNPWTVFAFVDVAKEGGHKSLLHTAAASNVGRMLNKYAKRNGIEVINIVRKPEQKALLEELGAKYVIDTSDEKWQSQLQELCVKLDCKLGFDAIAGEMPGLLIKALRPGATLYLYGSLSCKPAGGFEVSDLLYGDKAIRAIAFSFHADKRGRDVVNREVLPRLKDDFKTTFAATFPLTKVTDAIASYIGNMNQKLCLAPHLSA